MPFHCYILKSQSTGSFYVGHTENLTKRIFEHSNNGTPSIKNRGPWELFYSEAFETRSEAAQRERHIKSMKSRHFIEHWLERADRIGRSVVQVNPDPPCPLLPPLLSSGSSVRCAQDKHLHPGADNRGERSHFEIAGDKAFYLQISLAK